MSTTTTDRTGTFITKGGHLYYVTDEQVVFYTTMKRLADINENDMPHPVCMVVGLPAEATIYDTTADTLETRAVSDWVEAMDHHLEALAAAVLAINGEPKIPKLTIVAS